MSKMAPATATLEKGLEVLEALADLEEIGLSELARRLGLSAPTVFRMLATLVACGYVQKLPSGRYRLTLKSWEIGAKAVRRITLRDVARPFLERLVADAAETVHLSVAQGDGIVIIDKLDCRHPVRVDTFVGQRAPAHGSATGKAILAFEPKERLDALLPDPLPAYTARTITSRAAFERELRGVRRLGWARNREEWRREVCALAVPIRGDAGAVVAALSVTVPTPRFTADAVRSRLLPALMREGAALSREFAGTQG